MNNKIPSFLLLLIIGYFLTPSVRAQSKTYSFEQIDSLQKNEKRHIVVFIHTDWCRYCQAMINTTFKDDSVTLILNDNYWFAKLNAEENTVINFNDHDFKFNPTGNNTGIHELAEQLGTINGKVSYPTLCILNSNYEIVFQYNQFLSADNLIQILTKL